MRRVRRPLAAASGRGALRRAGPGPGAVQPLPPAVLGRGAGQPGRAGAQGHRQATAPCATLDALGPQELEARGATLRPDDDADLELRAGRCFRLDRDMFGVDQEGTFSAPASDPTTFLYLEKAMSSGPFLAREGTA